MHPHDTDSTRYLPFFFLMDQKQSFDPCRLFVLVGTWNYNISRTPTKICSKTQTKLQNTSRGESSSSSTFCRITKPKGVLEREKERVGGDEFTEGDPSSVYRRGWEKEGRWRRHAVVRGPPGRTRRCRIGSWSSWSCPRELFFPSLYMTIHYHQIGINCSINTGRIK